jgi:hypothetical protein
LQNILQDLKKLEPSTFQINSSGLLNHKRLPGLELNTVYRNRITEELYFGYGE